ncbi:hypothetical protein ACQPZJ_35385 [Actinoplanes sp. CA-054009]
MEVYRVHVAEDFKALIKPLDKHSEHRLHAEAVDAVYRIYQRAGVAEATRLVKLLCERFEDVRHDSYLTPEVFA